MKAAVYHAPGDVRLEELERPVPGAGEVLMAMRACGICGSDLLEWYVGRKAPAVLGHEPVGVVVETGSPPPGGSLPAVGRRVFVHHHVPCLRCERCRSGHETLCEQFRATRIVPGGFSELILVPAANAALDLLEVPDRVSDAAATAIEPLACVVRAQRRARVGADTRLLLVGGGPMGLLNAQAALAVDATVVVAERLAERRAVARELGAVAVAPDADAAAAALGGRPTVVMLCTSASPAWDLARAAVDDGGLVQLFAPGAQRHERRALDVNDLFFREIEIQASYSAGPADTRAALELIVSGAVAPERLVTHRFPLARAAEALATARGREGIKVIVTGDTEAA
jgi:L-iditol 2-dehydrogenase